MRLIFKGFIIYLVILKQGCTNAKYMVARATEYFGGDKYLRVLSMKLDSCQSSGAYNFDVTLRMLTNLCNPVSKG